MRRVLFTVLALGLMIRMGYAQKIKAGVLVIGNGSHAIGAGFQAAISGVKTVLLLPDEDLMLSDPEKLQDNHLISGITGEFLKRMRKAKGVKDTDRVHLDRTSINSILSTWADSTKNLTVMRKSSWSKLKRSGKGWVITVNGNKQIKAEVLVDADESGQVEAALSLAKLHPALWKVLDYDSNRYRTSIASGFGPDGKTATVLSLYDLLNPAQENLIRLPSDAQSLIAGQAAGATSAYAAFFKTKTSLSNLKAIQGELINYKLSLVPFADVKYTDSNWKAIQFVGLSGFLQAELAAGKALFRPDKIVQTAEVKPVIKSYYYKAQLWFDDYKAEEMTIGSTLDLVCRVGNKSLENTQAEVVKKWKSVYGFTTTFDPKRVINRREFAVLVNEYLKPFDVNIDQTGRVLR